MRSVAFKIASCNPNLAGILPDEFITEWCFVDMNPPGTFKESEGWQIQDEEPFQARWSRNNLLLGSQ